MIEVLTTVLAIGFAWVLVAGDTSVAGRNRRRRERLAHKRQRQARAAINLAARQQHWRAQNPPLPAPSQAPPRWEDRWERR